MGGGVSSTISTQYENATNSDVNFDLTMSNNNHEFDSTSDSESSSVADSDWREVTDQVNENLQSLQQLFVRGLHNEINHQLLQNVISPYNQVLETISQMFSVQDAMANESVGLMSDRLLLQSELHQNSLSTITEWSMLASHSSLQFSPSCGSVSRVSSDGFYPGAFAHCGTLLCSMTIVLDLAPRRENYFSFGLVAPCDAGYSDHVNINGCIGKVMRTWGVVDRRNNAQPAVIYAQGVSVGAMRSLREGDKLSLLLDLRNQSTGFNAGFCHLLLNGVCVYVFTGLNCEAQYAMGCTLCQDHHVTLVDEPVPRDGGRSHRTDDTTSPDIPDTTDNTGDLATSPSNNETATAAVFSELPQSRADPLPVPPFFPRDASLLARPAARSPAISRETITSPQANSSDESKFCCICLDQPKCVVLMPCKHLCVCERCCDPLTNNGVALKNCPICRLRVDTCLKVYL